MIFVAGNLESKDYFVLEQEKDFRNPIDNTLIGIYRVNFQGKLLIANNVLVQMRDFDKRKDLLENDLSSFLKKTADWMMHINTLRKSGIFEWTLEPALGVF